MAIAASTNARVYVSTTANSTAATASQYGALSYTEIGTVESLGEFGDSASTITFTALADSRVRKRKGVRDAGDLNIVCANDPLDAGQRLMVDYEATEFTYAFRVVLADGADANDTDSTFYFRGLVSSARLSGLNSNEIIKRNFTVLIDSAVLEIESVSVS